MAQENKVIDRELPNARLEVKFPQGGSSKIRFEENIQIKETQKSRFAEYKLIGRDGSMFAYTGAESRQFNLTFNITTPNLKNQDPNLFKLLQILRSTVVSNAKSSKGIPVIIFNYGSLWIDIKTICKSVSITNLDEGYYTTILEPRRVKITLQLRIILPYIIHLRVRLEQGLPLFMVLLLVVLLVLLWELALGLLWGLEED